MLNLSIASGWGLLMKFFFLLVSCTAIFSKIVLCLTHWCYVVFVMPCVVYSLLWTVMCLFFFISKIKWKAWLSRENFSDSMIVDSFVMLSTASLTAWMPCLRLETLQGKELHSWSSSWRIPTERMPWRPRNPWRSLFLTFLETWLTCQSLISCFDDETKSSVRVASFHLIFSASLLTHLLSWSFTPWTDITWKDLKENRQRKLKKGDEIAWQGRQ